MNGINILVEAKNEYTSQLKKILTPRIYEGFKSIYEDIINISNQELQEKNVQTTSVIKAFQKTLKEIPLWNQDMIKNEYNRIITLSRCDFFEDLTEAVFITNTKILTSVQINDTKSLNVNVNIPQSSHFVHKVYMETAKEFYKNPYVFDQSKLVSPKERHNNLREALSLIDIGINNAISNLLPIKDILKQGLTKFTNKTHQSENNDSEQQSTENDENSDTNDDDNDDTETDDDEEENSKTNDDSDDSDENESDEEDSNEVSIEIEKESNINQQLKELTSDDKKIILLDGGNNVEEQAKLSEITSDNSNIEEFNEAHESKINLISKIPAPNQISQQLSNNEPAKPIEEYKNIDLNVMESVYPTKIQHIEKIDSNNNLIAIKEVKDIIQPPLDEKESFDNNVNQSFEKKISVDGLSNPFMRTIKQSKFIKNKSIGSNSNKNMSFYKKKYEENSAHYNSITENPTITETLNNTINEIKDTQNSLKIIKNKIMLKEASSDEESENELDL